MVGYNVQAAVDTTNHLIVAHEVTNVGTDKSHLANMANQAKVALEAENLEAFADRGYFKGEEILACEKAGITVTLPKPQTSEAKSEGRFGKQDFRYVADEDIYICPTGEKLTHHFTNEENGLVLHHYWTNACRFKDYMVSLGFEWTPTMKVGSGCRVHLRPGELPKGRLVVAVSRHYTAVIDGTVHDIGDPCRGGTRCVYGYWRKL